MMNARVGPCLVGVSECADGRAPPTGVTESGRSNNPPSSGSVSRSRSSSCLGWGSGTGAGAGLGGTVGLRSLPPTEPAFSRSGRRRRLELRLIGILDERSVRRERLVMAENSDWSSSEVKSSS